MGVRVMTDWALATGREWKRNLLTAGVSAINRNLRAFSRQWAALQKA